MARSDKREQIWTLAVLLLLIVGILLAVKWNSGRVVSEIPQNIKVGDKLTGTIFIPYQKISDLSKNTPAIISLSKGEEIIIAETETTDRIIQKSSQTNNGYYLKIEDLIDYTFDRTGKYEFSLNIPGAEFNYKEKFNIK